MMADRLSWVDHDLVFPGPLGRPFSTSTLGKRWDALLAKAELDHVKFHSLRHASATAGKDANVSGKDMADRLGHATLAMTLGRYTHVDDIARRKVAQQIDDYLFGESSAS
jgi:integrase